MKKHNASAFAPVLQDDPINLPLKFSDSALIPGTLIEGNHIAQKYKLVGGEVVTFLCLGGYDNSDGYCAADLDALSRDMYGMDFPSIEAVWKRRLGSLSGFWHKVRMNLAE